MNKFNNIKQQLLKQKNTWLITGVSGFIGSNLLQELLLLNQKVIGLDNFSTGFKHNLDDVKANIDPSLWKNFTFIEGDIQSLDDCNKSCKNVDYVLHQAALGSVSRSIEDPISTNNSNVNGFLNMLVASKDASVKRFIYAASSSTYGDHPDLPKTEEKIGNPLSPYAVTKYVNELYASVFKTIYNLDSIGLRYFNVFGKRQNPNGSYAAVIPCWIRSFMDSSNVYINGDGQTSRDFCYIENVVQANILAAMSENKEALNQVYNIAFGESTSLNKLFKYLENSFLKIPSYQTPNLIYRDFRKGDVIHSLADISKASQILGYDPTHNISDGLNDCISWYINND